MIYTLYRIVPANVHKQMLGILTWSDITHITTRWTPDGVPIDTSNRWRSFTDYNVWLNQHKSFWSTDPDHSYFSDQCVDIGL